MLNDRICSGCGLRSCDGIRCYLEDSAIPENEVCLTTSERDPFVASQEYLAWCEEVDRANAAKAAPRWSSPTEPVSRLGPSGDHRLSQGGRRS